MKDLIGIISVLTLFVLVGCLGYNIGLTDDQRCTDANQGAASTRTGAVPTIDQIQQMLVDRGHDIRVDGIMGRETLDAWQEVVFNQYAREYMTESGGLE